tara:strand:- start:240 stop:419 length:180 start_codon:yes stop_codon:yes gene_type:complete
MNTQTFAQDQDFTAITDEELMAVNGGLLPLIPLAIGTAKAVGGGVASYGGFKAAEAVFG